MKTIFTLLPMLLTFIGFGQNVSKEAYSNAGGTLATSTYVISYTIGESFIGRLENSTSISQGFWPGISAENLLSVEESPLLIEKNLTIYPNPVKKELFILSQSDKRYQVDLYNYQGVRVSHIRLQDFTQTNSLHLENLATGLYILKIYDPKQDLNQSFKILKN